MEQQLCAKKKSTVQGYRKAFALRIRENRNAQGVGDPGEKVWCVNRGGGGRFAYQSAQQAEELIILFEGGWEE